MDTGKGISLILIPQPACPAALLSAAHAPYDFLHSGILRNASERPLSGFRLGWVIKFRSRNPKLRFGAPINLPEAIEPGDTCSVPAQEVNSDGVDEGAVLMGFFLAEVFLVGETPWRADLNEIKAEFGN
jgi:hypothetical protein